MQRGLITDWFLFAPHCLRIAPPLTIKEEELQEAMICFMDAVKTVCG
jgi:4-aminobutyrate aminotransferase-like enzyme